MRARLRQLGLQWRRIPLRTRIGVLIAAVAIAGLAWQHYNRADTASPAQPDQQRASAESGEVSHDGHDDGAAIGEYQPDPSELPPAPDFSPEAARAITERFAANFASADGNRDGWLARISPDVMPELLDQYRLTDIRNLPQAIVQQVSGPLTADTIAPTFEVAYSDGSRVEITVEMAIDGWKVSGVVPVDTPVDPAGPIPAGDPAGAASAPAAAQLSDGQGAQ